MEGLEIQFYPRGILSHHESFPTEKTKGPAKSPRKSFGTRWRGMGSILGNINGKRLKGNYAVP